MKFAATILFFVFFLQMASPAKDTIRKRLLDLPGKTASPAPILFDVDKQQNIFDAKEKAKPAPHMPQLLPNRVYLLFDAPQKKWVYVLTDFEAQLPDPLEAFRNLTVLSGKYLGADNPNHRYQLNPQGIWIRTFQSEQQYLWIYESPPKIKVITFRAVK